MNHYLNILDLCETGSRGLGPGNRYIIWVQGCPFHCKGCITPEGIPIVKKNLVSISDLIDSIIRNDAITGITISGGEPFLQASGLTSLLRAVKVERPALDVIVFSGFKRADLDWPEALELLSLADVLIDGKYIDRLNDNKGMRGSSNQRVHFLSDRLRGCQSYFEDGERSLEIHVYDTHRTAIGVPPKSIKTI